jgi:hypothetical protein
MTSFDHKKDIEDNYEEIRRGEEKPKKGASL